MTNGNILNDKSSDNDSVTPQDLSPRACSNDMPVSTSIEHDNKISSPSIVPLNNNNLTNSKHPTPIPAINSLTSPSLTMEEAKQLMLSQYIPWVNSTYGDTAKTKTITKKKYSRIIALLRFNAEQKDAKTTPNTSINSSTNDPNTTSALAIGGGNGGSELAKFKLWVKSKGFHLGPPEGHHDFGLPETENTLYLPTGTDKVSAKMFDF